MASSEAWAQHVAEQALACGLVLRAGHAGRVQVETEFLHDQRAHRGGGQAQGLGAKATFSPTQVSQIEFTAGAAGSLDFWIDDVVLLKAR